MACWEVGVTASLGCSILLQAPRASFWGHSRDLAFSCELGAGTVAVAFEQPFAEGTALEMFYGAALGERVHGAAEMEEYT